MRIKMKSILLLVIFNVIVLSNVIGQCVIRGKITDINGEVPIGVTFYLKSDNKVGTLSDINGEFSLKVPAIKSQVFVVSYVGYKKIEDTIDCSKGGIILKNYVLEPTATTLNAVTIVGRTQNNFDAHMENKKKLSSNTLDFISAETIKKTVDANVASAITRVTGVSSTSTGLITVRGAGDRYIKTTINGSRIPTLDPFTNNIKLDIFPASLVDNIVIAKTASPDLPGDWAGAYISIETKQYPEALAINFETSIGYNQQTTFQEVISSERSSTDWLGFDNKSSKRSRDRDHSDYIQFNNKPTPYQELSALGLGDFYKNMGITGNTPWNDTYFKLGLVELGLLGKAQFDNANAFESAKQKYNTMYYREHAFDLLNADAVKSEKALRETWNNTTRKAPLNFSQSFSIGNQTKLFGKTLGYLAGFRYQSAIQYDPDSYGFRFGVQSKIIDGKPAEYDSITQIVTKEIRGWSALLGAAYKLNANNTISFLFMPNVTGTNNIRNVATTPPPGSDSEPTSQRIFQFYESRQQMIYQLKTDHYLTASKLRIEFNASYTLGKSNLPDLRLTPTVPPDLAIQNSPKYLSGNNIPTGRYYRYLDENILDSRLSVEFPLDKRLDIVRKAKLGIAYQNGTRQQDNYFYQLWEGNGSEYIRQANPDAYAYGNDRFDIESIRNLFDPGHGDSLRTVQQYYTRESYPNNSVFGKSNIKAGFAMIDYSINSLLRFSGGLRVEQAYMYTDCNLFDELRLADNDLRRGFSSPSPVGYITIRPGKLNQISYLPSASLIIKLKRDEIAPINLRLNYSKTVARPSIRELSDNAYYDYELNKVVYGNSMLKMVEISNYDLRLESYFKSGDNVSVSLFYKNFTNHIEVADFGQYLIWLNNDNIAWIKGIEMEGKTNITKWLEFRANVTLVDSRSAFNTSYEASGGYVLSGVDVDRKMLNQAPYVVNTMLTSYFDKAKITASLSYNVQGPRVVMTGAYKDIPDVYELPRNLLDIKVIKKLGKHYNVSLKIMDLLNTSTVRAYKIDGNYDLVYDSYKYGTNYVFAFSYQF
jgi:hypothetical protein